MDEPLLHDPRTKQQLKDALYTFLYNPLLKQFKSRLESIIDKNCVLIGSAERSFVYKGEVYAAHQENLPRKMNRLNVNLVPIMDEYINEIKQLNSFELPYVLGFIGQVLNSSNHLSDYLLVLPESVHRPVEKMIASCPCKAHKLTQDNINELLKINKVSIALMKQRMMTNLLI